MSRILQLRRGNSAEHENFTGQIGEITMDTDSKSLRIHDGETPGGTPMARRDEIPDLTPFDYVVEWQIPTAENNHTWYRKYKSGWVEQGGISKFATTTYIPIKMQNSNYTILIVANNSIGGAGTWATNITADSFLPQGQNYGAEYVSNKTKCSWFACGIYE